MVFNQKEIDLLNAAYQVFVGRTHIFQIFKPSEWQNTGIENWVQTEYIVGLIDRDYEVTTEGKVKRGCDIIVKNKSKGLDVGIEIKAFTSAWTKGLVDGIQGHPKADLYLFLGQYDAAEFKKLEAYIKKNGFSREYRELDKDWFVMLVRK